MTSWKEFAQRAPEFAAFGEAHFRSGVAYLGTLAWLEARACIR
jgi:hypothetical protein